MVANLGAKIISKSVTFLIVTGLIFFLFAIGIGSYSFFIIKSTGSIFIIILSLLLGTGLFGYAYWSNLQIQKAHLIVAKARVYLKQSSIVIEVQLILLNSRFNLPIPFSIMVNSFLIIIGLVIIIYLYCVIYMII